MDRSLYERLGGIDAIIAVVRAFEDRAAKDDRIKEKFARTNLDRLMKEFVDQLCQDTGRPCTYAGLRHEAGAYQHAGDERRFRCLRGRPRRDPIPLIGPRPGGSGSSGGRVARSRR